jgi:hypothetical protein
MNHKEKDPSTREDKSKHKRFADLNPYILRFSSFSFDSNLSCGISWLSGSLDAGSVKRTQKLLIGAHQTFKEF